MFDKDFLRDRRIYCGLSQIEFAKKVGVSKQAVQKWESGASVPRKEKLQKISEVLQARIAQFSDIRVADDRGAVAKYIERLLDIISGSPELSDADRGTFLRIVKSVPIVPTATPSCTDVAHIVATGDAEKEKIER